MSPKHLGMLRDSNTELNQYRGVFKSSWNDNLKIWRINHGRFTHTHTQREPECNKTHTGRGCLDKCAARDAILQPVGAKPTHSRHITQWTFYSIIQAIPNLPPLKRLWRFAQQRDSSAAVSLVYSTVSLSRPLSATKGRRQSEKKGILLFFNIEGDTLYVLSFYRCWFLFKRNVWICRKDNKVGYKFQLISLLCGSDID